VYVCLIVAFALSPPLLQNACATTDEARVFFLSTFLATTAKSNNPLARPPSSLLLLSSHIHSLSSPTRSLLSSLFLSLSLPSFRRHHVGPHWTEACLPVLLSSCLLLPFSLLTSSLLFSLILLLFLRSSQHCCCCCSCCCCFLLSLFLFSPTHTQTHKHKYMTIISSFAAAAVDGGHICSFIFLFFLLKT